jgi:hypothetical protein
VRAICGRWRRDNSVTSVRGMDRAAFDTDSDEDGADDFPV